KDLESDLLSDLRVLREIDRTHATLAQLLDHQVVADGLSDEEVWLRGAQLGVHEVSATIHTSSQPGEKSRRGTSRVTITMMRTFPVVVVLGVLLTRSTWADDLPEVKSRSAIAIDAESGAEIFSKDADEIRPIASTTKIFVAMAVRKKGLDLEGWTE